jgi:hypothetical protein
MSESMDEIRRREACRSHTGTNTTTGTGSTGTGSQKRRQASLTQRRQKPESEPKPEPEPPTVPLQALQEERRKRQEYERQLAEYQAKRRKSPHRTFSLTQINGRSTSKKPCKSRCGRRPCAISESLAREMYGAEKFDAAIEAFEGEVAKNPSLAAQMRSAANPALFALQGGPRGAENARDRRARQSGQLHRAQGPRASDRTSTEAIAGRTSPKANVVGRASK